MPTYLLLSALNLTCGDTSCCIVWQRNASWHLHRSSTENIALAEDDS